MGRWVGAQRRADLQAGRRWEWRAAARAGAAAGVVGLAASVWAACPPGHADVTGNGAVNIADVQCAIITALFELGGQPGGQPPACLAAGVASADSDCNGTVNVADAQLIAALILSDPLSSAIDSDGNQCPDTCEAVPGLPGTPTFRPAAFTGTATGGGLRLRTLVPGHIGSGQPATGGDLQLEATGK